MVLVDGEPSNRKITDPADLRRRRGHAAAMHLRVGMGFDVHRTGDDPDRPFVLGGVRFADRPGLVGHSDADAVAHAAADALLGAAGLGDIGEHFPDTDPAWAGADSIGLLAEATRRVREAGWVPSNVDCTVVADEPKLAPHRTRHAGPAVRRGRRAGDGEGPPVRGPRRGRPGRGPALLGVALVTRP